MSYLRYLCFFAYSGVQQILLRVFLHIVVSNKYCFVFLFCQSSSCVSYVASFSGLSIRYSLTFIYSIGYIILTRILVNPPPFRGSLPRKSLISRMDWVSCAGDINLPHTPFPPARSPPNKKIKHNKIESLGGSKCLFLLLNAASLAKTQQI